jgi:hypothetical protein
MAKQITVNFQDDFAPDEFTSFSKLVVKALHSKFPGFLIHTNVMKPYLEQCHVHVYGLFDADESNSVEQAVIRAIEQMLFSRSKRDLTSFEQQPAAEPPLETPPAVDNHKE